jgi:hypothetical protein
MGVLMIRCFLASVLLREDRALGWSAGLVGGLFGGRRCGS